MAKNSKLGQIQVFYGDGKGKSTSSFGTAVRALGSGFSVHLVQFMKNGTGDPEIDSPGEIKSLSTFKDFSVKRFGTGSWVIGKPKQHHIDAVSEAFKYLESCLGSYDIIIADEILYSVQLGLLDESSVLDLISKARRVKQELILTGSHKPFQKIIDEADLVTEIKKVKHPYDSGVLARKGLEY